MIGDTTHSASVSPSSEVRRRLLGVAGSLRAQSYSTAVLKALAAAVEPEADMEYADIGALPHFDQDLYVEPLPEAVERFRVQIAASDGLVISSPEYNHGVPGVLKNAIDWASRPHNGSPLKNKPVLIVTSSHAFTGGVRAQYQIREALIAALARPVNTPEIVVGQVNTKIVDGSFKDDATVSFALSAFSTLFTDISWLAGRRTADSS